MNLTDLSSFVAVVEQGTITAAARAQGVPKSTISRRVARLEEALGVQLLLRSTRSLTVTDEGHLLYARAQGALQEIQDAGRVVREGRDEPRGRLVVTAAQDLSSSMAFGELLVAYKRRCPMVTVDVHLDSRFVDLMTGEVDVALRGHKAPLEGGGGLMVRTLRNLVAGFYVGRDYAEQHGVPHELEEFLDHPIVAHRYSERPTLRSVQGQVCELDMSGAAMRVNDFSLVRVLVLQGLGVGLLPVLYVTDPRLVRVLPQWSAPLGRVSAVWPETRFQSPKVRIFIDMAAQHFKRLSAPLPQVVSG